MVHQNTISILIKRANLKFDKEANRILSECGMTNSQFKILKYLFKYPEFTVTQRDLETYFAMTNPTVTGLLHNLQKKEFILKKANPSDARSNVIGLTQKSLDLKDKIYEIGYQLNQQFTKNLSECEKEDLLYLLEKLLGEENCLEKKYK